MRFSTSVNFKGANIQKFLNQTIKVNNFILFMKIQINVYFCE